MLTIRARRLFDGHDFLDDQVVTVHDGRVVQVAPGHAAEVDLGDATLLPGLIDCHVHLAFDAGPDPVATLAELDDAQVLELMRRSAARHLAAGVTTVRDLGDRSFLALRLDGGPEVLAAGPPITTVKGHCWFLGGEVSGEEGVREAVRERAGRGAHVVKMMLTGGEMTEGTHSHLPQFTLAEAKAAADEAHAHGLPIAGHAHGAEGIAQAIEAGFDTIEHCSFMTEESAEPDHELLARLVAAGSVVSVTAGMLPVGGPPPPGIVKRLPGIMRVIAAFREHGVDFVIGTDAGIGPPKPHGVLPHGAKMLTDFGWSELEVLRAITARAARVCRVGHRKGRIAPGFDADLVAFDGDPGQDITALQRPAAVYRLGSAVPM
ncbi:amidohydrolase family protein [Nonomuraea soli]|uniref:Imidazolonepropionase-like amidohydrolase n=1 Tax=Nonomuraea soli TaxID=1032476 RepID=A0A7W0CQJ1_9ACTN|nr:amidohydrolase family protein [Nonomuraea soli]MBA2895349.1 imidazolonepropionase-like amidohydrolase [Nonomuraea soli]